MDTITRELLETLKRQAVEVGSDLMGEGLELLRQHLEGRASDEDILRWLRTTQDSDSQAQE